MPIAESTGQVRPASCLSRANLSCKLPWHRSVSHRQSAHARIPAQARTILTHTHYSFLEQIKLGDAVDACSVLAREHRTHLPNLETPCVHRAPPRPFMNEGSHVAQCRMDGVPSSARNLARHRSSSISPRPAVYRGITLRSWPARSLTRRQCISANSRGPASWEQSI